MSGYKVITAVSTPMLRYNISAAREEYSLPAGFRILVNNNMQIVEPVLLFLFERFVQRGKGWRAIQQSQRAACDDLFEWFSYLQNVSLDWATVDRNDFIDYLRGLENAINPRTGRGYSSNMLRHRMRTVLAFYRWALSEGLIAKPLTILTIV